MEPAGHHRSRIGDEDPVRSRHEPPDDKFADAAAAALEPVGDVGRDGNGFSDAVLQARVRDQPRLVRQEGHVALKQIHTSQLRVE